KGEGDAPGDDFTWSRIAGFDALVRAGDLAVCVVDVGGNAPCVGTGSARSANRGPGQRDRQAGSLRRVIEVKLR
ncbi:hypothetical protein AB0B48_27555, partial [Micromonospora sp. NPDC049089]|uniref:hypothetical protein n=1 Tax=Micromonospora sp. NPDC049089 TaxID=3155496 RepID=UPI0033C041D3